MPSTSNQAYIFLSTVYAGLIIGFLYDCCRMIRKMVRVNVIVIGVLSFLVLFYVNDGNVRFYTLLGFIIGWILYLLALSPLIMKGLNWIYDTLARLIQWLGKIIQWPFRQLWKALAKPYRWLKRETDRIKKYFINVFQKFRGKTEG